MMTIGTPMAVLLILFVIVVVLGPVVCFRWRGIREDVDHDRTY